MKKVKKIIIIIILCLLCGLVGYFGTLTLDKMKNKGTVNITVTFDDNESFILENTNKLTKEDALKEWPYIINIENTGDAKGLYQIIIKDIDSNIERENLEYSLYLNDNEVSSSKLSDIKENILYTHEINGNTKQEYKLYIWVNDEFEEAKYEYKLEFNTIKAGGPGF